MIPTGIQSLLPPDQSGMAQQPPPGTGGPQGMAQQPPSPGMGGPSQQPPGGLGIGSAVGSVNEYVDMYETDPDPLAQQYQADGDFLKLLALQKIKSLQEAFANDYAMQMAQMNAANGEDAPITTQVENEVVSNAMQGMGPPMSGSEGMLGLPIDNAPIMTGAGGGIVAFAEGRRVIDDFVEQTSPQESTLSLEEMLRQKLIERMGGTGRESPVTQYDLDQLEADKLRDAREANWAERQKMLAAQQDPERRRKERIDQAIHAAATTYGGVGEMGSRIAEGDRRRADAYEAFDLGVLEEEGTHIDEQLTELLGIQSGRQTLEKDFNTSEDAALAEVLTRSGALITSQKQLEAALAQAAKATNQKDYVNWRVDVARMAAEAQGIEWTPQLEADEKVDATEEYISLGADTTGQFSRERLEYDEYKNWQDRRDSRVSEIEEQLLLATDYSPLAAEYKNADIEGRLRITNRIMEEWDERNPNPRLGGVTPTPTPASLTIEELITANPGLTQAAVDALMSDPSEEKIRLWNEMAAAEGVTVTAEEIIAAQSP